MKLRPRFSSRALLLPTFVVAGLAGCRSVDNAQVDLLERELRQQESYIYELEDYLVEYSEKLRRCRCTNPAHDHPSPVDDATDRRQIPEPELADEPAPGGNDEGPVPDLADEPIPTPGPTTEAPEAAEPESIEPGEFDPTQIDPGEIDIPELEVGPSGARLERGGRGPRSADASYTEIEIPDPVELEPAYEQAEHPSGRVEQAIATNEAVPDEPTDEEIPQERRRPERIVIRRLLADQAEPSDSGPGGLLVVVEALNQRGEPVEVDGEVSLMVLTPSDQPPQQRVDRWDFTPEDATAAWQSSQLGDGLHLQLPLQRGPLEGGDYELWARVITADGRKLAPVMKAFGAGALPTLAEAEAAAMTDHVADVVDAAPLAEADPPRQVAAAHQEPATADGKGWQRSTAAATHPAVARASASTDGGRWLRSSRASSLPRVVEREQTASPTQRWTPFK